MNDEKLQKMKTPKSSHNYRDIKPKINTNLNNPVKVLRVTPGILKSDKKTPGKDKKTPGKDRLKTPKIGSSFHKAFNNKKYNGGGEENANPFHHGEVDGEDDDEDVYDVMADFRILERCWS